MQWLIRCASQKYPAKPVGICCLTMRLHTIFVARSAKPSLDPQPGPFPRQHRAGIGLGRVVSLALILIMIMIVIMIVMGI